MAKRKNPLTDLILGKVVDLAADHYSGKKNMKRKNPLASSSYIPVKIEGNKLKMRLPNRNPGTLRQAKVIASKLGVRKNPEKVFQFIVYAENRTKNLLLMTQGKNLTEARKKAKAKASFELGIPKTKVKIISVKEIK